MTTPKYKDFEDYLQENFIKQNPHLLDDDIPDAFSDWLCDLDPDKWIRLGDLYGVAIAKRAEEMVKAMKDGVL